MVFCRGCGKQIHETATSCPHCGALQGSNIGNSVIDPISEGIKVWSWGAFFLN